MAMTSTQQPERQCVSCGRTIGWDANHCQHCGHDFRTQRPGPSQLAQPPATKSHTALIIAVVVVVIVVVLAVILLAAMSFESTAAITINIHSTHILFSVDCTIYIDNSQIGSRSITPGDYIYTTYTHHWTSSGQTTVHVSAVSTGGGLGSQSDYTDLVVSDGGAYVVDLYV